MLLSTAALLASGWQTPATFRGVSSPVRGMSHVRMDVTLEPEASTEDKSLEVGAPPYSAPQRAEHVPCVCTVYVVHVHRTRTAHALHV